MAKTPNWVMVENQFGSWEGPHMYAATDTDPCAKYPHAIWTQTRVKKIRPATDDEIDAMKNDDDLGDQKPVFESGLSVDDLIAARNYLRARAVEQEAYITDVAAIYQEIGRINDLLAGVTS